MVNKLFAYGSEATLFATSSVELDGKRVRILGITNDFSDLGYCHYIVEFVDGTLLSNGYRCFSITSCCLE